MNTQYCTVAELGSNMLDKEVTKLLKQGWQLHGNPYYTGIRYCQAMIKKTKS